ncbi:NADPH-dependent 2,4-dienoyl-CoA reductase, sulfur reductase [Gemmobacter megaterium]|uniref:NADPH-dependent 2,4-dienoyl-CoA reductase, sulfur reductase n=1 Tax=Gemmobacter megaterium TaxID=1086013 RepID=A0A1N7N2G2_9RHOB|nr:FAD/NAD(P)-binding oxidoreductase [Gemmobacter megaterium]GGE12649.1 FAD/NAD(P)-binding oxidoreductase [Gemmobacter megaterium]SIS92512.1 NADPH-dependent 2,4-dienoyl-CoA reductase, sulfur reductase [Gemmobacter megaterium]
MTGPDPLPVAVIGAGPAGLRAAQRLVAAGLRPILLDEAAAPGGQIYRRPPPPLAALRDPAALYGADAGRAMALARMFETIRDRVDYRPQTLVWNAARADGGALSLQLRGADGVDADLRVRTVVLATGAMDRVVPVPGWTRPGVFSLGGAQIMLKAQAHLIGRRPVFAGSGPLLYLVAWQYAKAGALPAAVIDVASFGTKMLAAPRMLARPRLLLRGARMALDLRRMGVPMIEGALAVRIEQGTEGLSVHWRAGSRGGIVGCDAVGMGHGLKPERQLADLLGCPVAFDPRSGQWHSTTDAEGRSPIPGVYLAGDMVRINGAHSAEAAGEMAASALLRDMGLARTSAPRRVLLRLALARTAAFRRGLERAFALPPAAICDMPDETVVCRCEGVSAGDLRRALDIWGPADLNRLKAVTRCGMGRCQGRLCGATAGALMAAEAGLPPDAPGPLRGQAPVKPLPLPTFLTGGA